MSDAPSRFSKPTTSAIDSIATAVTRCTPNMLFAGISISDEAAQVGYLLGRIHSVHATGKRGYKAGFGNSLEEAMSGAIKLARHSARAAGRKHESLLIVDPEGGLIRHYNGPTPDAAQIVPGLSAAQSVDEASKRIADHGFQAAVLAVGDDCALPSPEVARFIDVCRSHHVISIGYNTPATRDIDPLRLATAGFDICVYGEELADRQLPFGCFVVSDETFTVWNHPVNALAHTSTFGANAVVLRLVIDFLRRLDYVDRHCEQVLAAIAAERRVRNDYFRRYVNPEATRWLEAFNLDVDILQASGSEFLLGDGRVVLDLAGGTGANLRGHNPQDVCKALSEFDPHSDYVSQLGEKLTAITGFDQYFPASSGATAVENALRLARMARPARPGIVTFTGNFAGKTLAPMSLSVTGPQKLASIKTAFAPYSSVVRHVDPRARTAVADLIGALADPEVGLVWFECVQGMSCEPIPPHLLQLIADRKAQYGYLVGIDEILTGFWRSGESFFAHSRHIDCADIIALSKPLSDMICPVGVTLVTDSVVDTAAQNFPQLVQHMRENYANNLSAFVACNALSGISSETCHASRRAEVRKLRDGLAEIATSSKVLEGVSGTGIHLRLMLRKRVFPHRKGSTLTQLIEGSLQELLLSRCGVVVAQLRLFPPLFMPVGTAEQALSRLSSGLPTIGVADVYLNAVRGVLRGTRSMVIDWFKQRLSGAIVGVRASLLSMSVTLARMGVLRGLSRHVIRVDHVLSRLSRQRLLSANLLGLATLTLAVPVNRRSVEVPLVFAQSGGRIVVAGTNFGRREHPSWSTALMSNRHCDVLIKGQRRSMRAEPLAGAERASAWRALVAVWPAFADYERHAGRQVRVFALSHTSELDGG